MTWRRFDRFGIVALLSLALWIGATALKDVELGERADLALTPAEVEAGWRDGVEWQGIYLKEQKVGYMRLKKWREGGLYHLESDMTLQLTVMKARQRIQTHTRARLDPEMTLRDFSLEVSSGVAQMIMRGQVQGNDVQLEIDSADSIERHALTLQSPPRLELSLKPLLLRQDLQPGQTVTMSFFDPTSMGERDLQIQYEGTETLLVMDQEVQAHRFVQTLAGAPMRLWTNAIGEVLREELPMGLVGQRESSAEARYGVTTGTVTAGEDLVESVSVQASGPPFPATAPRATLALSGLQFEGLGLDGGRQRWEPAPDGLSGLLTLEPEPPRLISALRDTTAADVARIIQSPAPDQTALAAELKAATTPEAMVQSDHPRIRRRAESIAALALKDLPQAPVLDLARKVNAWAYDEIDKQGVVGVPSALETLETLRGDCNEHATLVTALLRSLGVPARLAVGIAFLPDHDRFFYHAWVEVWSGRWVAIDPTFGQLPADVGHVRFVIGGLREQFEMFRVIGQLQMRHLPSTDEENHP
jgi:hypothetical protein